MAEFQKGIYLEVKKGTIGTGVTARDTEYRNFWMTFSREGDLVHCFLLDQDFNLTNVKDALPVEDFISGRLIYIPQGEKRYRKLFQQLSSGPGKKTAPDRPAQAPDQEKKAPDQWWAQPEKVINPGDLFKRDDRQSRGESNNHLTSGNWWEGPKKNIQPGDIFKKTDEAEAKTVASIKKRDTKETITKKTWWDK